MRYLGKITVGYDWAVYAFGTGIAYFGHKSIYRQNDILEAKVNNSGF